MHSSGWFVTWLGKQVRIEKVATTKYFIGNLGIGLKRLRSNPANDLPPKRRGKA